MNKFKMSKKKKPLCGHKVNLFRNKFGQFTSETQCFQSKVLLFLEVLELCIPARECLSALC